MNGGTFAYIISMRLIMKYLFSFRDELEVGVQYTLALLLSDLEGQLSEIRVHLDVHHGILIQFPATGLESIVIANL